MRAVSDAPAEATVERDPEAQYQDLFRRHFRATVRLAQLLGADDAEDVAQEAFVRLHEHRRRLRDPAAALAHVRRTTANLATSRLRHLRVVRRTPGEVPRTAVSAEETVVAAEQVDELRTALGKLSARHREALVLRYWLDLPVAEVADALDVPVGTAKSTISRAQAALANLLEERP
ncbi:RNA polymerase sigma factor [Kineococcus sp. R86509]|uniref:RNA polymerase sigma factor n=1 Tax=Kineococcus sp. R86509 TaxID=3093851 RepID=UPI0036D3AEEA